ncbi:MAG TPA: SAM-dependent methyltransferase [Mycobacteriales bacterium]|nr:SAM-dependent methyltransferase [Mycobacteriales bacterium]
MGSLTWRPAMQAALYGPAGFYRTQSPAAHFRTSPTASSLFAEAVRRLALDCGLDSIVDIGAGDGDLLRQLHAIDPEFRLLGVELRDRPDGLPDAVGWRPEPPERVSGLVIANEWLDNIPLDLTDGHGVLAVDGTLSTVDAADTAWLRDWWADGPAEIGRTRDEAWSDLVGRIERGLAVAVDYGHVRDSRPAGHTLTGYRGGYLVDPVPDGSCDLTAHVAVDSCLAAGETVAGVPGRLLRQREALRALGIHGRRPPIQLARDDPPAYLRALARASEAGELTGPDGLGSFWWVVQPVGIELPAGLRGSWVPGSSALDAAGGAGGD